jgi:radical SAM superfamily enzyme YgiQ (UPF0313 family)
MPPLGLLTVASMLPKEWEKRLIDMNITQLTDSDLEWADYVFVSAMVIQRQGVKELIERCKKAGKKLVAGGPLFTSEPENFDEIDYLVLNEGEITLPQFLADIQNGIPKHIYTTTQRPDLNDTPYPSWELIKMKKYSTMIIQLSRGCPYDCEFCDIITLFGRFPRMKSKERIIGELDALYQAGWKGGVTLADDNFISNKKQLKKDILPAITEWMKIHKYPFSFMAEVSVNLADDEEMMRMLIQAGVDILFVGIETPNEQSLAECNKIPNKGRDLLAAAKKMQRFGFVVDGGFILGFDNDDESIFFRLVKFIQQSGIVTAMVGLLNAPRGSKLYERLHGEGRLLLDEDIVGNNTAYSTNIIPKMKTEPLINGYKSVLEGLYSAKAYYTRVKEFFNNYKPPKRKPTSFHFYYIKALVKSFLKIGVLKRERYYFWNLIFWALLRKPRVFPLALRYAIYRIHFAEIAGL